MKSEKKFQEVVQRRDERFVHNNEPDVGNVVGELQDVTEESGRNVAVEDSEGSLEASVQSSDESGMCSDSSDDESESAAEDPDVSVRDAKRQRVSACGACESLTFRTVKALVRALENPDESSAVIPEFVMNATDVFEEMATPRDPTDPWEDLYKDVYFYEDVMGQILDQAKAIASRRLEMDFFKKMKVYTKVPRHEALQGGHKIISTR